MTYLFYPLDDFPKNERGFFMKTKSQLMIPEERIEKKILLIKGQKVMLDKDLAELYDVPTKSLNLAVKRNITRFPVDFMFRLTKKEVDSLRFQIETSNKGRGGRRYLPYIFTQEGVAMLSSVLNSPRAIAVNIAIMRVFVKLRQILATHKDLAQKVTELEKKYDGQFRVVFEAIRRLMREEEKPKYPMGFQPSIKSSN